MRALGCLLLLAASALPAAAGGSVSTELLRAHLGPLTGWTAADLDGDSHPDFARAGRFHAEGQYFVQQISICFSGAQPRTITVRTSSVAARIVVRDVDGDLDHDLILETLTREPIAVLLNDGDGRFHEGDLETYRSRLNSDQHSFETLAPVAPVLNISDAPSHHALPAPFFVGTGIALAHTRLPHTRKEPESPEATAFTRGPPSHS